jgi:hypothetical protein
MTRETLKWKEGKAEEYISERPALLFGIFAW